MGLVFYLLAAAVLLAVVIGLVVLVAGALLGGVLGGIIGGASGARQASPEEKELGAYRGLVWGGCLGVVLGVSIGWPRLRDIGSLTAEGFTLLGGRLDYINGEPVASVVYRRRKHIINLFVARRLSSEHAFVNTKTMQGYNTRHWSDRGLDYWAVSDLDPAELGEFVQKIIVALYQRG